jgi:hypothetical protein
MNMDICSGRPRELSGSEWDDRLAALERLAESERQ